MMRAPIAVARGARSVWIWAASSRVGTRINADGWRRPRRTAREVVSSLEKTASPNASVLPAPVGALPHTSRPARESGRVAAWIGKGVVMPRCLRAVVSASETPSSSKRRARGGAAERDDVDRETPVGPREERPTRWMSRWPGRHRLSTAAGRNPAHGNSIVHTSRGRVPLHSIALPWRAFVGGRFLTVVEAARFLYRHPLARQSARVPER